MTTLETFDSIKMLRETFCVAQAEIRRAQVDSNHLQGHVDRLQRLIDDCDQQRPLGTNGKSEEASVDREEQKELMENKGWQEFRDSVRANIEFENRKVIEDLGAFGLDRQRTRRDAFEDVWVMVLAFEEAVCDESD